MEKPITGSLGFAALTPTYAPSREFP